MLHAKTQLDFQPGILLFWILKYLARIAFLFLLTTCSLIILLGGAEEWAGVSFSFFSYSGSASDRWYQIRDAVIICLLFSFFTAESPTGTTKLLVFFTKYLRIYSQSMHGRTGPPLAHNKKPAFTIDWFVD